MKKLLANSELPYAMSRPCSGGAPGGVSVRKATSTPTVTGPGRSRPATKVAAVSAVSMRRIGRLLTSDPARDRGRSG